MGPMPLQEEKQTPDSLSPHTENRPREGTARSQPRASQETNSKWHLDLGLQSRTVRKQISVVEAPQPVVFGYGSPGRLRQSLCSSHTGLLAFLKTAKRVPVGRLTARAAPAVQGALLRPRAWCSASAGAIQIQVPVGVPIAVLSKAASHSVLFFLSPASA